ncbi:MAG: phosphatase PAP2 family protein [Elusimicrobia bacterium]|nr:phosphatase PAP2 family protein [Elusimicrobiota bacterium]
MICFFAVSRVYIGDHWLSDVLGGLVLACLAAVWVMPAANDKIISS